MFFYEKKDYQIEKSGDWYRVSKPDSNASESGGINNASQSRIYISRFDNVDSAVRFITQYTEPTAYPSTYYATTCHCGYVKEGWRFCETDNIIFEQCNKCRKPLYDPDRIRLNKKSMDDFDLDAFLNM